MVGCCGKTFSLEAPKNSQLPDISPHPPFFRHFPTFQRKIAIKEANEGHKTK